MLERKVEILEQLPDRITAVEQRIVQLRDEMRAEFSTTRTEARAGDDGVVRTLREEIHDSSEQVMRTLREEIHDGDAETRRFMRVLHEELIERIRLLGDAS
jgi:hypothetical protein